MKKIAFFAHAGLSKPGGVERVLSIIANELIEKGYDVSIISYTHSVPFYSLNKNIKLLSLDYNITYNSFINSILFLKIIKKLKKIIKVNNFETVISVGIESSVILSLSLFLFPNFNKISWIHYSYHHQIKFRDIIFRKILGHTFNRIVVLNRTDKVEYAKLFKNKVFHIPNPKTLNSFEVSNLNNKRLLAVGRLDKVKNFQTLIKIFHIVINQSNLKDWNLHIFGNDHGEKPLLIKTIYDLDLSNNVFIHDAIPNIEKEYIRSDIYLMTSIDECFPLVLLEAKEFGLPIISFDCNSGPRDIIHDCEDGFLINVNNVEEYVNKLTFLISDYQERIKMGNNAKKNVREFDVITIIDKWLQIL